VIWDRIVRRKEDAVVNVVGKNKYMFRELSSSFRLVSFYVTLSMALVALLLAFTRLSLDTGLLMTLRILGTLLLHTTRSNIMSCHMLVH
jgi:hypothetical protein